ncbi:hypothetical protein Sru01_07920 [Sphaerisporangium rufum]|uniref:Uncharacterized protein n=1 Tax=Sphaerisporangium rufum TaxID=1381558 RepID=A0A919V306_9ACTN|nr:hypothetical protein [Sphaerisporangium rufum]GII75810.1 hypothetical protein Sru01_07920 [Sphaerisporangium rufum]
MHRDQRRYANGELRGVAGLRGLRHLIGTLAACGAMVGSVAGCAADRPDERLLGAASFQAGDAGKAACPSVARELPTDIPEQVISLVARNLGQMELQRVSADLRLAEKAKAQVADPAAAQQAVLGTLAGQRSVLIEEIANAFGEVGEKPAGLAALADCTVDGGAAAAPAGTETPVAAPGGGDAPAATPDASDPAGASGAPDAGSASPAATQDGGNGTGGDTGTGGGAGTDAATQGPYGFRAGAKASVTPTGKPGNGNAKSNGNGTANGNANGDGKANGNGKGAKATGSKAPVAIVDTGTPEPKAADAAPSADPAQTATAEPSGAPAATATGDAAATDAATDAATPAATGQAAAGLAVACPPVADALGEVPGVIKSEVARNLGLLELQIASVDRQLTGQDGQDGRGEALLSALQRKRSVVVERIGATVYQATGSPAELGSLVECTLNDGGAATATPADTAAPADTATPADTAAPTDGTGSTGDGTTGGGSSGATDGATGGTTDGGSDGGSTDYGTGDSTGGY